MLHRERDSGEETYYDVLGAKEDASHDEIRAHYKAALLNSHPDKVSTKQEFEHTHKRFLKIQKAWEVLGDAVSKGIYDRELKARRSELLVVADEVKLEEMNLNLNGSVDVVELVYPCRCGDNLCITSDELEEMGILLLVLGLTGPAVWAHNTPRLTICERDKEERRVLNATVLHVAFLLPSRGTNRLHVRRVSLAGRLADVSPKKATPRSVAIRSRRRGWSCSSLQELLNPCWPGRAELTLFGQGERLCGFSGAIRCGSSVVDVFSPRGLHVERGKHQKFVGLHVLQGGRVIPPVFGLWITCSNHVKCYLL
ncbi:hypothetical protein Taro_030952 [Colocasia esculenta]|uniref:J domain-containing protein n=1 Tax=Colocasia esculenta TaxID=4460 RepID=A0A843VNR6_COLES|nr:hypothetical protein [Colocasia esculenta]